MTHKQSLLCHCGLPQHFVSEVSSTMQLWMCKKPSLIIRKSNEYFKLAMVISLVILLYYTRPIAYLEVKLEQTKGRYFDKNQASSLYCFIVLRTTNCVLYLLFLYVEVEISRKRKDTLIKLFYSPKPKAKTKLQRLFLLQSSEDKAKNTAKPSFSIASELRFIIAQFWL